MSHFVMTEQLSEYDIQGVRIRLKQHPSVFPPSPFGLQFAQVMDLRPGERVADIGTGTGLLAILAAKKGAADVVATDTCAAAVEVARYNARTLNAVDRMSVLHGAFFGDARAASTPSWPICPRRSCRPPIWLGSIAIKRRPSAVGPRTATRSCCSSSA